MKKVSEFMGRDHMYLNRLWVDFLSEKDTDTAKKIFERFFRRFGKHLRMEEEVLSPLFNEYLRLEKGKGPTIVTHRDHETLIKLLVKIKKSLDAGDSKGVAYTGLHFKRALIRHEERENLSQYSLFDSFISIGDREWQDILYRIYKIRKKGKSPVIAR